MMATKKLLTPHVSLLYKFTVLTDSVADYSSV